MAVSTCPKHGRSGFFATCEHVDVVFSEGHFREFESLVNMLFCDSCWEKYDVARFETVPDLFDDAIHGGNEDPLLGEFFREEGELRKATPKSWCEKCIAEIQTSDARSS